MSRTSLPVLLRSPCLGEMARVLETVTEQAGRGGWSHEQCLRALCDVEASRRVERRRERLLKESKVPDGKTLATLEQERLPLRVRQQLFVLLEGPLRGTGRQRLGLRPARQGAWPHHPGVGRRR